MAHASDAVRQTASQLPALDTEVAQLLAAVGIRSDAVVLMHSALWAFGVRDWVGAAGADRARRTAEALLEYLSDGTLVVPAFTYDVMHGGTFDRVQTPSKGMGVLAEMIRRHPAASRSPHPFQSVAAVGRYAEDICGRDTPGAFSDGGPFARFLELDGQLLFLGAPFSSASLVHGAEERAAVPYRYWKVLDVPIATGTGAISTPYRMFARDLSLNPQLDLTPLRRALEAEGAIRSVTFRRGTVLACSARPFMQTALDILRGNPLGLVQAAEGERR